MINFRHRTVAVLSADRALFKALYGQFSQQPCDMGSINKPILQKRLKHSVEVTLPKVPWLLSFSAVWLWANHFTSLILDKLFYCLCAPVTFSGKWGIWHVLILKDRWGVFSKSLPPSSSLLIQLQVYPKRYSGNIQQREEGRRARRKE